MKQSRASSILGKAYVSILLVIFGGIVLHAPLSVGFGTLLPDYELLIKSWKEILMILAVPLALFLMYRHKQIKILKEPILVVIEVYATLHLLLLAYMPQGINASLAGLAIDLRYVLYFALVYIAIRLYPQYRRQFIRVGIVGALIVLVFALLQVFILPYDVLKYLGYNKNTIIPYLVIDRNYSFIRINSTLRGPNPLGAYAGMILVFITAALAKNKINKEKTSVYVTVLLSICGGVALWSSYSRSALVATVIGVAIILFVSFYSKLSPKKWLIVAVVIIMSVVGLYVARDTRFVSNVVFHRNPTAKYIPSSNEGHVDSIEEGTVKLINQPFGAGIGSTGSASIIGGKGLIIENHYLYIAHEVGWLGLALFMLIFIAIMHKLWNRRKDWLAIGVLASGVSLALIGILLPVWADDTVSIVWWGLAAIALTSVYKPDKIK